MDREQINNIISNYIRNNLSPKQHEQKDISLKYEEVKAMLMGVNFQNGSYARFTAITPVNDLDVIWELPKAILESKNLLEKIIDPNDLDISDILVELANKLEKEYKRIGKNVRVKAQSHSVGIYFGQSDDDFSIDIVPAIPTNKKNNFGDIIYKVPEIAKFSKSKRQRVYEEQTEIGWIKSDPKGYIKDAQILNKKNDSFRKVVKFIKTWKKTCKDINSNFRLKSFHLELIVNQIFKSNIQNDCYSGIDQILRNLMEYLSEPTFEDRAGNGKYVDDYISELNSTELNVIEEYNNSANQSYSKFKHSQSEQDVIDVIEEILLINAKVSDSLPVAAPIIVNNKGRKPWYDPRILV